MSPTSSLLSRRFADTPSGRIAFAEAGEGPVALFVHGVFLNGDLWERQVGALSDLRRCIAVDLLGHGESAFDMTAGTTLVEQATMLVELLDALGVDRVDLVGNDTGGAIAQLFAARAPERLRTLTLTNCDTHDGWPPPAFASTIEMARAGQLAPGMPAIAGEPTVGRAILANAFEDAAQVPDELVRSWLGPFLDPARAEWVQRYVASMDCGPTVAIEPELRRLETPTLVVWGTGDDFFDVKWSHWLAEAIPGTVRRVELPGARLFFPFERADELNAELRSFWTG
jgi:pimeloyl-ACP methyl ester carboxylesterase